MSGVIIKLLVKSYQFKSKAKYVCLMKVGEKVVGKRLENSSIPVKPEKLYSRHTQTAIVEQIQAISYSFR